MPPALRVAAAVLSCLIGTTPAAGDEYTFYHENVLGTSLELFVRADSRAAAHWAEDRVLGEIDRLASVFSGYDSASEFRRWQDGPKQSARVSVELFELLQACDHWRSISGGAFDPRVETLSHLWARTSRQGRTPTTAELDAARAWLNRPAWWLDPSTRTAERLSDSSLTLNSIAKGFIIERGCNAALDPKQGVRGLMLNIGGDLRVCGDAPRTVGIAPARGDSESAEPFAYVEVRDQGVATSGDSQRGLWIQGKWYSHIFDPRTGLPAGRIASATVIAPRSADANALATTLNVLSPEEGLRLAASLPGVECLIVGTDGRVARSDGWHRYERPAPTALALADDAKKAAASSKKGESTKPAAPGWGDDFEMVIKLEINRPDAGGRYRRPYVAVWVEDSKGFPVRNLVLWVSQGGSGPFQWLPDLKRWYRADQARKVVDKTEMVFTLSRPTRPPGKYTVVWDGKDDHGKPLPAGEYTVFIDAAREHGTYQSIRKSVTIAAKPFAEDLKGNVEIKSAAIEYRRKSRAK